MKYASRIGTLALVGAVASVAIGCEETVPTEVDTNSPPIALATAQPPDIPTDDGNQTLVTLSGVTSSDPEGGELNYSWSIPGATLVSGSATGPTANVTFPGTETYSATLVVTDAEGLTDVARVTIGLLGGKDDPPVANLVATD